MRVRGRVWRGVRISPTPPRAGDCHTPWEAGRLRPPHARTRPMTIHIEVSCGELLDKLTILEIKSRRMEDPGKRANVEREKTLLAAVWDALPGVAGNESLLALRRALMETNEKLWVIEDDIRDKERAGVFDEAFIALARSVYRTNDQRAALKKQVDQLLGSRLTEEKSYQPY